MPSKVAGGNGLKPITQLKKGEYLFHVCPWFWGVSKDIRTSPKDDDCLIFAPLGNEIKSWPFGSIFTVRLSFNAIIDLLLNFFDEEEKKAFLQQNGD
jgi:hypothetical protein